METDIISKDAAATFTLFDDSMSQLTPQTELDFNKVSNKPGGGGGMVPVEGSSPSRPGTGSPPTKLLTEMGVKGPPPPDYSTAMMTTTSPGATAGAGYKARRRSGKIGLRPKIIIFSDKKDLIRVTLDSEEDSEEDGNITHFKYSHKHHGAGKSAKRRSLAGDGMNVTSSRYGKKIGGMQIMFMPDYFLITSV